MRACFRFLFVLLALGLGWSGGGLAAHAQLSVTLGGVYAEPASTPRYGLAVSVPVPFADHRFDLVPYGEYSNGKWKKGDGPSPGYYSTGIDLHLNLPVLARALRPYVGTGVGALGTDKQTRVALNLKGGLYVFPLTRRFFPFVQTTYRLAGSFEVPNLFDTVSIQGGVRIALNDSY